MKFIDADKLKEFIATHDYMLSDKWNSTDKGMFTCGIMQAIDEQPTADVRENVRGEWRRDFDGNEFYWYCTNCKEEYYEDDLYLGGNEFPKFCPNCGADMMKEVEE